MSLIAIHVGEALRFDVNGGFSVTEGCEVGSGWWFEALLAKLWTEKWQAVVDASYFSLVFGVWPAGAFVSRVGRSLNWRC